MLASWTDASRSTTSRPDRVTRIRISSPASQPSLRRTGVGRVTPHVEVRPAGARLVSTRTRTIAELAPMVGGCINREHSIPVRRDQLRS